MIVCTACGASVPDEMRHCPQCGSRLPEPEPEAPGNTSHFGDQDIKNLMSRIEGEQGGSADEGNLLAGLPRPKVGSMLSPLRGGQTAPTRRPEKRARSASGSTVMGMPIMATGEQRTLPAPRPRPSASTPGAPVPEAGAAIDNGPSIQSLDSFQDDLAAPPPAGPASPLAEDPAAAPDSLAQPAVGGESTPPPAEDPSVDRAPEPAPAAAKPDAPSLPSVEELDITSPDRPTEMSPAAESSGAGNAIVVIVIAAIAAGVAFFLLK